MIVAKTPVPGGAAAHDNKITSRLVAGGADVGLRELLEGNVVRMLAPCGAALTAPIIVVETRGKVKGVEGENVSQPRCLAIEAAIKL